ncbi:hypothetical protein RSAG8_09229, partial [Rhizoctonia solani AG-8 WAC10335]
MMESLILSFPVHLSPFMSQCPIVSGTPQTVPATQVSWVPLDATPYMLQAASIVQRSQEPSLGQLSPETLKRRLNLLTDEEGVCYLPSLLFLY